MTAVTGLKELEAKLLKLGSKDGSRAIRTALLAAGAVILTRAQTNTGAIQSGSGALAASLGVRYARGSTEDVPVGRRFVAKIGPRAKDPAALAIYNAAYGRRAKGIFYGHLVERGFRHVGGKSVSGQRVLTSALQQTRSQAIEVFTTVLGAQIERLVAKQQRASLGATISRKSKPVRRRVTRLAKRARRSLTRATKQVRRTVKRVNKSVRKSIRKARRR